MKKKHLCHSMLLAILFVLSLGLANRIPAQSSKKIDWERMQRDLEIMEGVLNKLLAPAKMQWELWNKNAHGIYFEDYGTVFWFDNSRHGLLMIETQKLRGQAHSIEEKRLRDAERQARSRVYVSPAPPEASSDNRVDALKEQLIEFLENYADAIGQLQPDDRITILVDLKSDLPSVYGFGETTQVKKKAQVSLLEITALKKDIVAYRQGRIDAREFRNRIDFDARLDDERMKKNIDILAEIMETALSKKYHEDFGSVGKNRGLYLNGLGAVFFLKAELNSGRTAIAIRETVDEYLEHQQVEFISKGKKQKTKEETKDSLENFKNELIRIVADYGHTLRTLDARENVVVSVDFVQWLHLEDLPERVILKIKKQDLDEYSRGNLTFAEFKERVGIQEY